MSAYIVEDHLIDYILSFQRTEKFYIPSRGAYMHNSATDERSAIGQILIDENYRSVNFRYRAEDEPHAYRFRLHRAAITGDSSKVAVQVLAACGCLDYQSCETSDWRQSDAWAILEQIKSAAIRKLAGYSEAKWGAPEHPATPTPIAAVTPGLLI